MAVISIISDAMRRPRWFKFFVLIVIFTFTGYWFGRHSCNYALLVQQGHDSTSSALALKAKTAKFNREAKKIAMQRCCRKLSSNNLSSQQIKNVLRHIIVDRKNKLLFCYIPKVASSNMKRLMLTLQNFTDDSNAIGYFDHRGFEFLSDVAPDERNQIVKTFYKFLFVRNPLARILSAYRNKFQERNGQFQVKYGRDIVRKYRKPSISTNVVKGDDVTLQEFVRYLIDEKNGVQNMNEHWMPMYELCQPCYVKYDFIGSFESLDLDTSALLAKLRASKAITFPRKQSFYGKILEGKEIAKYYLNLTLDEYRSLYKRYNYDFKCFSYKFPFQT